MDVTVSTLFEAWCTLQHILLRGNLNKDSAEKRAEIIVVKTQIEEVLKRCELKISLVLPESSKQILTRLLTITTDS